jgi:hypothetical protein
VSQVATLTGTPREREVVDPPPPIEYREDDRRSSDALDQLSRRLDSTCTGAVDPLEIAAALEADGLTDSLARERFNLPDVFSLAEELYRRVPLRISRRDSGRAERIPWRCVGRGVLYALPGLYFFELQATVSSRLATLVLAAVTVGGWAASQAISVVAYSVLGDRGRPAALGLLRWTILAALLAGTIVGVCPVESLGWSSPLTAVAIALAVYIVAATVLVFLDADLLLAATLAPGGIAAAIDAIADPYWLDAERVLAVMGGSIALVVIGGLWRTRGGIWAGALPTRRQMLRAVPFAAYGALAGALVASPLVASLVSGNPISGLLAAAMLPLTLSMGFAELELRRHLATVRTALKREHDVAGFVRVATRSLRAALSRYAAALAALSLCTPAVLAATGRPLLAPAPLLAGYFLLGVGLFPGMLIAATGRVGRVAWSLAGGLCVFALLWGMVAVGIDEAFSAACLAVLVCLVLLGELDVRKVVNHA